MLSLRLREGHGRGFEDVENYTPGFGQWEAVWYVEADWIWSFRRRGLGPFSGQVRDREIKGQRFFDLLGRLTLNTIITRFCARSSVRGRFDLKYISLNMSKSWNRSSKFPSFGQWRGCMGTAWTWRRGLGPFSGTGQVRDREAWGHHLVGGFCLVRVHPKFAAFKSRHGSCFICLDDWHWIL